MSTLLFWSLGWLICKSLRTPVTMLRLLLGVVSELVAVYAFTCVDVFATEMFSGSESESWTFERTG